MKLDSVKSFYAVGSRRTRMEFDNGRGEYHLDDFILYYRTPLLRATHFADCVDFWDFHEICFTEFFLNPIMTWIAD